MNRQEWLEARREGIGGTDAAAILGLSRYRTAIDVWQDKLRLAPERPQTPAMLWGQRLEDAVADAYVTETGRALRRVNGIRRARHVKAFPMLGSIDRLASGRVVELKTSRSDDALGDPNGPAHLRIPPDWYVQVQHYMEVASLPVADVAVLIGGSDFRVIEVPRDQPFVDDMLPELAAFWKTNILGRVQPDVQAGDLAFLSTRYPKDNGAEIVGTSEVAMLVREYVAAQARKAAADASMEELRAKIESAMGEASRLVTGVATVSWKAHERTETAWRDIAGIYRNGYRALVSAIDDAKLADQIAGPYLDADAIQSLYTQTKTVRPFRVDARREDA